MQNFDFTDLINDYSKEYRAVIPSKGHYKHGSYVKGEPQELILQGAIISMGRSKLHQSEGNRIQGDAILFSLTPLSFPLSGAKIIDDNTEYSIENELENGEFTGVWQYTLKHVSAFNEGGGTDD